MKVFTTRTLHAQGHTDADIRTMVRRGAIERLRRGWFADPGAPPQVVAAIRAGASLTCVSALSETWTPNSRHLHVRWPANSRRRTAPGTSIGHQLHRSAGCPGAVDDQPTALAAALNCVAPAEWVAMADALLHEGWSVDTLHQRLHLAAPGHRTLVNRMMGRTNPLSESGTESLLRYDLASVGLRARPQVRIGRFRVDLLLGERLVLECDSVAHHTGMHHYARDRLRDQELTRSGFQVLRFTYHQLVNDRAAVISLLQDLCRRGLHRAPRRSRPL